MGMSVTISVATEQDAEQIFRLQYLCFQSEAALYGNYRIDPLVQSLDSVREEVASDCVFVARLGDEVVGSVRGAARPPTARRPSASSASTRASRATASAPGSCAPPSRPSRRSAAPPGSASAPATAARATSACTAGSATRRWAPARARTAYRWSSWRSRRRRTRRRREGARGRGCRVRSVRRPTGPPWLVAPTRRSRGRYSPAPLTGRPRALPQPVHRRDRKKHGNEQVPHPVVRPHGRCPGNADGSTSVQVPTISTPASSTAQQTGAALRAVLPAPHQRVRDEAVHDPGRRRTASRRAAHARTRSRSARRTATPPRPPSRRTATPAACPAR